MAAPTLPAALAQIWASVVSGTRGNVNTIPSASAAPLASLADGFPLIDMTPLGSGGIPPSGADMNGILQWLTSFAAYNNAGGLFPFQAALSTAWGGYPKGAVLISNDGAAAYVSLANNNTTDFNSTPSSIGTLWGPWAGNATDNGKYQIDTGAANAYVCSIVPPVTANFKGLTVSFKALNTNTGASTLNVGGGATPLVQNNGAALFAGQIQAGQIYTFVYDAATSSYWLADPSAVYQEGSWTPNIQGLTMNSGALGDLTQTGYFYRIGNIVFWHAYIGTSHGQPPSFSNVYVSGANPGGAYMNNIPHNGASLWQAVAIQYNYDLLGAGAAVTQCIWGDSPSLYLAAFPNNHGGQMQMAGITFTDSRN